MNENVQNLLKTGHVSGAVIISKAGETFAHAPEDFFLGEQVVDYTKEDGTSAERECNEAKELVEFMKMSPEERVSKGSVWISEVNYFYLKSDEDRNAVFFKSKNGGAAVVETKTTYIVGIWTNDTGKFKSAGPCNLEVLRLANKLVDIKC